MLDASSFRSVLGRFASGIVVVTVRDPEGKDHGMTVSAFTSVSLEPPLVLVCVDRGATMHDSLYAAERFAINLLSDQQEALSRRFAETRDDRFDGVGYTRDVSDAALLDDALASLECTSWVWWIMPQRGTRGRCSTTAAATRSWSADRRVHPRSPCDPGVA